MPDYSSKPDQFRQPLAEELPEEELIREPTQSQIAGGIKRSQFQNEPEIDNALRQSSLERIRGDKARAEVTVRQALAMYPESGALHEALGDLLADQGRGPEAISSYRLAESCGAKGGIESKIARIALKQDRGSAGLTNTIVEKSLGPIPLIASTIVPGLGLALAGDMKNAAIWFFAWLSATALSLVIPPVRLVYVAMTGKAEASGGAIFLFSLLGLISTVCWVYSIWLTWQVTRPAEKDGH